MTRCVNLTICSRFVGNSHIRRIFALKAGATVPFLA